MKLFVSGGRNGAREAAEAGYVAIIVDALRSSATTASLLHYGVKEIIIVEQVEEVFAEARKRPGSLMGGERGSVKVEGFDFGNSPLQAPPERLSETVVFSSSNMSRCCVEAARCPAVFLGTLPTLTACARQALAAARRHGSDLCLIPAGAVVDEFKLAIEDYVAAGGLIEKLVELAAGEAAPAGDAAQMALASWAAAQRCGLEQTFLQADNGLLLTSLGFEDDVRFAWRIDVFETVPQVKETYDLPGGGIAAVLRKAE